MLLVLCLTAPVSAQSLSVTAARHTQEAQNTIVVNTEMVSLTVSARDAAGRFVGGLEQAAFAVYENGVKQEVSFFSAADSPASVGIVFDVSGSMNGARIERARLARASCKRAIRRTSIR